MNLMLKTIKNQTRILSEPAAAVMLKGFAESGINLELGFWVADPEKGMGLLRSEVNLLIWDAFQENHIEMPFPQRDIRIMHMPEVPPLNHDPRTNETK
jgi:small-conductance mechanosensitive channel